RYLFSEAEDGIRGLHVTGVQTCALPIYLNHENEVETNIRSKISALCNRIEWSFFVKPGSEYLFTGWSPETEFSNATPLVGRTTKIGRASCREGASSSTGAADAQAREREA